MQSNQDPVVTRFLAAQERRLRALSALLAAKAEWQASLVEMSAASIAFGLVDDGASRVESPDVRRAESLEASMRTHQACIDMLTLARASLDQELTNVLVLKAAEGMEFCTLKIQEKQRQESQ